MGELLDRAARQQALLAHMLTLIRHPRDAAAGLLPHRAEPASSLPGRRTAGPRRPHEPLVWKLICLIACDIADDRRREEVSAILSSYGARVQLSV